MNIQETEINRQSRTQFFSKFIIHLCGSQIQAYSVEIFNHDKEHQCKNSQIVIYFILHTWNNKSFINFRACLEYIGLWLWIHSTKGTSISTRRYNFSNICPARQSFLFSLFHKSHDLSPLDYTRKHSTHLLNILTWN